MWDASQTQQHSQVSPLITQKVIEKNNMSKER